MYRIKVWMPVETSEDMRYDTKEAAAKEKAQLEETQPENIYEVVESEEERDFIRADTWSKRKWDVTFVRYRGEEIEADTEEEAREIAEEMKEPNERVGGVMQPVEEMPHVD